MTPLQMVENTIRENPCGDCTVCCEVLGVREIGKPFFQKCQHLGSGCQACGIYKDRPYSCSGFECVYRMGIVERPDKIGILVSLAANEDGCYVEVYEARNGAYDGMRVVDWARLVKKEMEKICGHLDGIRIFKHGDTIPTAFKVNLEAYPGRERDDGSAEDGPRRAFKVYKGNEDVLFYTEEKTYEGRP